MHTTINQANVDAFKAQLTKEYERLYKEKADEYKYSASLRTPAQLAEVMTMSLVRGTGNKEGEGIKCTLKALKIKNTYAAIKEYFTSAK